MINYYVVFNLFFLSLSFIAIFFNISHPPMMGGQDLRYFENRENAYIVGCMQILIAILCYCVYKKEHNNTSNVITKKDKNNETNTN